MMRQFASFLLIVCFLTLGTLPRRLTITIVATFGATISSMMLMFCTMKEHLHLVYSMPFTAISLFDERSLLGRRSSSISSTRRNGFYIQLG